MKASNITLTLLLAAGLSMGAPIQDQSGQPTADQQNSNKADREVTQQIRKSIVSDKSLSIAAHNVKIVTRDGAVTLKGKVKSEDEKKAVEDKATQIAGAGKVTDDIVVSTR
jgi:hyperosmotically inducible periplasmic protein